MPLHLIQNTNFKINNKLHTKKIIFDNNLKNIGTNDCEIGENVGLNNSLGTLTDCESGRKC